MVLMRTQQKSDLLKYLLHERNKKPKKIKSNKEAIFKKAIDLLEEYKSSPSKKKKDTEDAFGKHIAHQLRSFSQRQSYFPHFSSLMHNIPKWSDIQEKTYS